MTPQQLEFEVLKHRYLYYVESSPIVSDFEYDSIERQARTVCDETSPVHGIGSSLPSSYTDEVIEAALKELS